MNAGDPVEFKTLPPIRQEQLRAYAQASGDHNPIHLDEAVARSSGLPGVIAHGMLSAAFIGERALELVESLPELRGFRIAKFQSRFKAMVLLGDEIQVGGTLKEAGPDRVVLDLQARNQRGEVVTQGVVELGR